MGGKGKERLKQYQLEARRDRDISASVTLWDIHFSSTLGNLGGQKWADSFLEEATILLIIH